MADFDESKKVSTEDMEQVAGGTNSETIKDAVELWKHGFFSKRAVGDTKAKQVQDILHRLGYTKCQMHYSNKPGSNDRLVPNVYADKDGNIMSREQFWKEFDEEFI